MSDVGERVSERKAGVENPVCMEPKPFKTYKTLLVEAPSEATRVLTGGWFQLVGVMSCPS
jgi:hypothetical protein